MKDVIHVDQLKVLQDLLKIKETDGIFRVFRNQQPHYYTLEGYWYFLTEGKEELTYTIDKVEFDRLAESGEIKLYRSEHPKSLYDVEISDKGEFRLAKLSHGTPMASWVLAY